MSFLKWTPLLTLEALEKEAIRQAVLHHSGNLTAAAEDLDMGLSTLYKRLDRLFSEVERQQIRPKREWWK